MSKKKCYILSDLGPGDGGKGGMVHAVSKSQRAHTIIKVGGAQGSHGVRASDGQSFNFSHFGCGTFEGVKTHISNLMVIEPIRLMTEARLLINDFGLYDVYRGLTIDEEALCVTPFHTFASQLNELSRRDNPRGTIGMGVGEAFMDAELYPESAIRVKDLGQKTLLTKLRITRDRKISELEDIIKDETKFLSEDRVLAKSIIKLLLDPAMIIGTNDNFKELTLRAKVVKHEYLKSVLSQTGNIVVESSHGILTDNYFGFSPHTSRLRTIPENTIKLLNEFNYDGRVIKLGVSRAYQIRHGAGPMVTASNDMLDKLLPGSHKDENRWQGKVRVGPLDLVSLKYAIDVCGGEKFFDGLAISWLDQIVLNKKWSLCHRYHGYDQEYFSKSGKIIVSHLPKAEQEERQKLLSLSFKKCQPIITDYDFKDQEELINLSTTILKQELNIPARILGLGAKSDEKILL